MGRKRGPQTQANTTANFTSKKLKEDIRVYGRWVLRQTKIRQARGQPNRGKLEDLSNKRKHPSRSTNLEEASSQESCVGENSIAVITTMNDEFADIGMWGSYTTGTFISIMLDEVKKEELSSSKMDRNFTPKQWKAIEGEMERRLQKKGYTVEKLKGKLVRLKRQFRIFRDLKEYQTGLGWDPVTETVIMDDQQWKLYIQAHPEARGFRDKGLEHYDLLAQLLGNSFATGAFARGNRQGEPTSEDERQMEDLMDRIRVGDVSASGPSSGGKRKSDGTDWDPKPCKKKGKAVVIKDNAWEKFGNCQQKKAEYYEQKKESRKYKGAQVGTEEAIEVLNSMEDFVEESQFFKAFGKLVDNEQLRVAFLKLNPGMRQKWVNNLD